METVSVPMVGRVLRIFRRDAVLSGAKAPLLLIAISLTVMLSGILSAESGAAEGPYFLVFSVILLGGGALVSSTVFSDMHDPLRYSGFLLLPASHLEKYLVRFIQTTILWVLLLLVSVYTVSLITEQVNSVLFGVSRPAFDLFGREVGKVLAHFLVLHSMFFAGAVSFRRFAFLKTLLMISAVLFILTLLTIFLLWLVFRQYFTGFSLSPDARALLDGLFHPEKAEGEIGGYLRRGAAVARSLYYAVLPAGLWLFSYLRLRGVQATEEMIR